MNVELTLGKCSESAVRKFADGTHSQKSALLFFYMVCQVAPEYVFSSKLTYYIEDDRTCF